MKFFFNFNFAFNQKSLILIVKAFLVIAINPHLAVRVDVEPIQC